MSEHDDFGYSDVGNRAERAIIFAALRKANKEYDDAQNESGKSKSKKSTNDSSRR